MGRAPCCDKMGLNKGSWTPEEDQILISFIHEHGHANWRALPRLAGLLRCGKSCRLRWINYLRPDIKRGKFTEEEEQIVIKLHQKLGNRWSVIAAKLPGRTDNEIKNVWHTHLKKKLRDDYRSSTTLPQQNTKTTPHIATLKPKLDDFEASPISPQYSSSRMSSMSSDSNERYSWKNTEEDEILKLEYLIGAKEEVRFQFPLFPDEEEEEEEEEEDDDHAFISRLEEGFGYWCDLVNKDGELPDLPLF